MEKQLSKRFVSNLLYEICSDVHSTCNDTCPVFFILQDADKCNCFKDGVKMYDFLVEDENKT